MEKMIDFTIIIPHKNQPVLLAKSIASIPHHENVQIIVVDDNSDPSIVNFKEFPGLNDSNVEVILTKEGKGAGYVRNVALKYVKGRWVTFLGADDFFLPNCADLMRMIKDEDYELIFFKGKGLRLPDYTPSNRGDGYNERVDLAIHSGNYIPALLYSCDARKFYKFDFLKKHDIHFSECKWGNDVFFMGQVARYATKYKAIDVVSYCVTESGNNLTSDRSLESQTVRFLEECKNVKILRPRYHKEKELYSGLFQTWINVWKINKIRSLIYLPKAIAVGQYQFVKVAIKAKFN